MFNRKEVSNKEIERLNKSIEDLEKEKINILRKVPFSKWNRLSKTLNDISEYYTILIKLKEELSHSSIIYEEESLRIEKEKEIRGDIEEVKRNMSTYILERDSLLEESITKEEGEKLQEIYVKISYLESQINIIKCSTIEYINKMNTWD